MQLLQVNRLENELTERQNDELPKEGKCNLHPQHRLELGVTRAPKLYKTVLFGKEYP